MAINRPNVFSPSSSSTPDFFFDVARKAYGDFFQTLNIAGYVEDVVAAETVVAFQSGFEPYVSDPWVSIKSNNAQDAGTLAGAQTVRIKGVDTSGNYAEELVTLNGTTAVTFTNSYRFINEARVESAGTQQTNLGTLTIENTPGVYSVDIEPKIGTTQIGAYLVPNGFRMVLMSSAVTAAHADNKTDLWVSLRRYDGVVSGSPVNSMAYRGVTSIDSSHTDGSFFVSEFPLVFEPGQMAYYTAEASAAANCIVAVQGYGILCKLS